MRNSVVFIGEGKGANAAEARNNAYVDTLRQMGEGLGYDLSTQYLREFLGTGRIQLFGTYVSDVYETEEKGVHICLLFVVTPEAGYYAQRSEEYIEMLDRQDRIDAFLDDALSYYKENRDGDALVSSLKALAESLSGPVLESRYEPEEVLKSAERYLSNIKLKTVGWSDTSTLKIRAKRDKGLLSPRVERMIVDVVYPMVNIRGEITESVLECITDSKGQFTFERTNPFMLKSGTLTFRIHIPEDLVEEIREKAPEGFLDGFMEKYRASEIKLEYLDAPARDPSETVISVTAVNTDGEEYFQDTAVESFRSMLRAAGAGYYTVVPGEASDSASEYQRLREAFPGRRYFFLVRLSVTDYRESLGEVYVRADGNASGIDANRERVLCDVDSFAVSSGPDGESAAENALAVEASVAAGSMISVL